MFSPLIPLLPNRVRRNYLGGYLLDTLENAPSPEDGARPEDWIASTVPAINPGMEPIEGEGLATVQTPEGRIPLQVLFAREPEFFFGPNHAAESGPQLGFLVKLLDSSMRLHVQAHPTAEFAQKHLNSPWGKLETYVILGLRDPEQAYIRLGFQRPPSPEEWHRIVLEQDIPAMDACFDRVPVRVGEVWLVPGGLPHAIGEGVLMLEVMEPSDLVVRCEFDRDGVVVPPQARFMQTPVDLAMQIFDFTPLSVAEVENKYRIAPRRIGPHVELLIGPEQTNYFVITRLTVNQPTRLDSCGHLRLGIVAEGEGTLLVDGTTVPLKKGARFLLAAAMTGGEITPRLGHPVQILFCAPGQKN